MKTEQSTLKRWGATLSVIIALITLSTFSFKGIVWAADQRYVTNDKITQIFKEANIHRIEERIDLLELKVLYMEATKAEQAQLKQLKRKRETLLK